MKKHKIELLIIIAISALVAILLPNYLKERMEIVIPSISEFVTWFLVIFTVLAVLFFSYKPKEKLAIIPNGYQELYNERNQIAKKGVFDGGKLLNGSNYIYKKDGVLSHIEIYKDGVIQN